MPIQWTDWEGRCIKALTAELTCIVFRGSGEYQPARITGNIISGGDAGNYNLIQQTGLTVDITPAQLSITATDASKTYGQTAVLSAFTSSGLQNG